MLISQAIETFIDARTGILASSTVKWYKYRLGSLVDCLGDLEIDSIKIADLRRWRRSIVERPLRWADHPKRPVKNGGLSVYTVHGYVRAARAFFRWLHAEGEILSNPARRLALPSKPKTPPKNISPGDALAILAAAEGNARDYALLRFLVDTGCRVGGVVNLEVGDLDLEPDGDGNYQAIVREKGRGGERQARVVYYGEVTARALLRYLDRRADLSAPKVFLSERHGNCDPLGKQGVYRMIGRYARELGIEGRWNPHAWRHAFAKGMLQRGASLGAVSRLMGHSGIEVTDRYYGQWTDAELARSHAAFSWIGEHDDDRTKDL